MQYRTEGNFGGGKIWQMQKHLWQFSSILQFAVEVHAGLVHTMYACKRAWLHGNGAGRILHLIGSMHGKGISNTYTKGVWLHSYRLGEIIHVQYLHAQMGCGYVQIDWVE